MSNFQSRKWNFQTYGHYPVTRQLFDLLRALLQIDIYTFNAAEMKRKQTIRKRKNYIHY